jgi:hypothetical protein
MRGDFKRNYLQPTGFLNSNTLNFPFKGESMKKLFAIVCTLVLGGALSVAQTSAGTQSGSTDQSTTTTQTTKKTTKTSKKHHKGGKKSKKSSTTSTTQPPK